jgi:hypothetical protein
VYKAYVEFGVSHSCKYANSFYLGVDETDVTLRAVISLRGKAVRLHTLKVQAETQTSTQRSKRTT